MDNLVYLKEMKNFNTNTLNVNAQCRTAKALEIIAEQIINLDNTLACLVSSLENIEVTIKQRN